MADNTQRQIMFPRRCYLPSTTTSTSFRSSTKPQPSKLYLYITGVVKTHLPLFFALLATGFAGKYAESTGVLPVHVSCLLYITQFSNTTSFYFCFVLSVCPV
ncbi:hypothetical protein B0H10DRAFT_2036254 [Mycena sp. CBHHK59/15]|nr:hypothetical protein B0H10DRAFT_2036254 [Mycena sp. CBHHK59/15]